MGCYVFQYNPKEGHVEGTFMDVRVNIYCETPEEKVKTLQVTECGAKRGRMRVINIPSLHKNLSQDNACKINYCAKFSLHLSKKCTIYINSNFLT